MGLAKSRRVDGTYFLTCSFTRQGALRRLRWTFVKFMEAGLFTAMGGKIKGNDVVPFPQDTSVFEVAIGGDQAAIIQLSPYSYMWFRVISPITGHYLVLEQI